VSLFAIFETINQAYLNCSYLLLKGRLGMCSDRISVFKDCLDLGSRGSGFERTIHMQVSRLCRKSETAFCIFAYSFTVNVESVCEHLKVGVINVQTNKKVGYCHLGCDTM
jgi:hypothetical protein